MSHDRGCWKCGRDIGEYRTCEYRASGHCAKESVIKQFDKHLTPEGREMVGMISVAKVINDFADNCYDNSKAHGFYDDVTYNLGEKLCLIHSEISEALEVSRKDIDAESEKIPGFKHFEEEMADAVIRIFDTCAHMKLNLGGAIIAKHEYNKARPYKHGKKF